MSDTINAADPAAPTVPQILVVPTAVFHKVGVFQGILTTNLTPYLDEICAPDNVRYMPRPAMEEDPSFKQLIPYVVFRKFRQPDGVTPMYFVYTRTKLQGEQRLHGKRSLGVGGHIEIHDGVDGKPYEIGLVRELLEETVAEFPYEIQAPWGLLNDDSNAVGAVHLGVVHFANVLEGLIEAKNSAEMADTGFHNILWLVSRIDEFESWSQIIIRHLANDAQLSGSPAMKLE